MARDRSYSPYRERRRARSRSRSPDRYSKRRRDDYRTDDRRDDYRRDNDRREDRRGGRDDGRPTERDGCAFVTRKWMVRALCSHECIALSSCVLVCDVGTEVGMAFGTLRIDEIVASGDHRVGPHPDGSRGGQRWRRRPRGTRMRFLQTTRRLRTRRLPLSDERRWVHGVVKLPVKIGCC